MSYKEQLQANNTEISENTTDIQAAIDMVNALPDATSAPEVVTGVYTLGGTSYATAITIPGLIGKERFCIARCDDFDVTDWETVYGFVLHCQKLSEENEFRIEAAYGDTTGSCVVISSPTWDSTTGTLTFNSSPNYKLSAGDWSYIGW